jgi:hypothetical protein
MFKESLEHRVKYDLDHILDEPSPLIKYLFSRYPHTFWGFDKAGLPLYIECIGDVDAARYAEETSFESVLHYHRYMQEFLQRKVLAEANYRAQAAHTAAGNTDLAPEIEQMIFITNIGSASMSTLRSIDFMKAIAKEDSVCYPELMSKTWILNAGWIFKTAYAIAKPFLDPGTTAKFIILRGDGAKEMAEDIGTENLPEFLKGTESHDQVVNFRYHKDAAEMAADAKAFDAQLKQHKKDIKDAEKNSTEAPAPIYTAPQLEIVAADSDRATELKARAEAKGEDASMWMRMTSKYAEKVFFIAEHGLAAYEARFEADRVEALAECRKYDALSIVERYGDASTASKDDKEVPESQQEVVVVQEAE